MERTRLMPPARWLPRVAALLLLCAAPLFTDRATADDPPAAPPPAAPAATASPSEAGAAAGAGVAKSADAAAEAGSPAAATTATTATAPSSGASSPAGAAVLKTPKPKKPRRGGIHPCMTPDPGFGSYDTWSRAPSMGQMIAPKNGGGVRKDGGFDLILHFHGHEPIRKEFVKTSNGVVLVGIDLGIGSGAYSSGFGAPGTFTKLVASVEAEMARRSGNPKAHVRKLGLSAWSAGYGAIEQILRQTGGKNVDAVILLDSLHAGYDNEQAKTLKTIQIEPFIAFAKRAAAGKTFMFMSHSSIIPPGYASTTEVADYVMKQVGGKPAKSKREDVLGLDMIRKFDKGNFHVRGYEGDDKPDHCAHLGLIAGIMKTHILPRWKTPATKIASPKAPATVKTPPATPKKGDATKTPVADAMKPATDAKKTADAKKPADAKKTAPAPKKVASTVAKGSQKK